MAIGRTDSTKAPSDACEVLPAAHAHFSHLPFLSRLHAMVRLIQIRQCRCSRLGPAIGKRPSFFVGALRFLSTFLHPGFGAAGGAFLALLTATRRRGGLLTPLRFWNWVFAKDNANLSCIENFVNLHYAFPVIRSTYLPMISRETIQHLEEEAIAKILKS